MSNFEQRLLSEIEFRLERTPVEESDEEVQHDEIPSGRCIAPIFDKKLKHFRAVEGAPVTFTCKVVGIPVPKVNTARLTSHHHSRNMISSLLKFIFRVSEFHIQTLLFTHRSTGLRMEHRF